MKIFTSSVLIPGFFLILIHCSPAYGQAGAQVPVNPDAATVYKGKEVDQKAQVKKKPEPSYTRDARRHGVEGTVVIRCIFAATGKVTNIHVISGLPDGLTERAIKAAEKIKFVPAMKDGKAVSMWIELQYNFHLF